jgi:hypothetical protein
MTMAPRRPSQEESVATALLFERSPSVKAVKKIVYRKCEKKALVKVFL